MGANYPGSHYSEVLTEATPGLGNMAVFAEGDFKGEHSTCLHWDTQIQWPNMHGGMAVKGGSVQEVAT